MTKELIDRLTDLSLLGYYDKDFKMLCVHFFGKDNDLMAYLRPDLTWELREVVEEKASLYDTCEWIYIKHNSLGTFEAGSKFDEFVRSALTKLMDNPDFKDEAVEKVLSTGYVA